MKRSILIGFISVLVLILFLSCYDQPDDRTTISLEGTWQISRGSLNAVPLSFNHTIPVPGFIDMAEPPLYSKESAFWYRKTFTIDCPVPFNAKLIIGKAKYGTKVYLNGVLIGEHLPNFTRGIFNVRNHLKGDRALNELIVRVGQSRDVPAGIIKGEDIEKSDHLPGIWDSVKVILSGSPHIVRQQIVPDIKNNIARVVALIRNDSDSAVQSTVNFEIHEAVRGELAGSGRYVIPSISPGKEAGFLQRLSEGICTAHISRH